MKKINPFLFIGLIGILTIGSQFLVRIIIANTEDDIWWTHAKMRLSLEEAKDDTRLYIIDKPIENVLKESEILVRNDDETIQIDEKDFSFRVNNWDSVRANHLNFAVYFGIGLGISLGFVICGLFFKKSQKQ